MNYRTTREFARDFKRLSKRYKTLDSDLLEFKKILNTSALGIGKHFVVLTRLQSVYIVKARFFCQSLKKKDLRIIYAYIEDCEAIEFIGIEFIELCFKGDKPREDEERIRKFLALI